jgi:hypothetical protein
MLSNKFNFIAKFKQNYRANKCTYNYFILNNNENLAEKVNNVIGNEKLVKSIEDVNNGTTCNQIYRNNLYDNTKLGYLIKQGNDILLTYKQNDTVISGVINRDHDLPSSLRIFIYKIAETNVNTSSNRGQPVVPMTSNSVSVNVQELERNFPNNTICKDPASEEAWALKYFIVYPNETVNDELIEMKIGDDMISKEPEKQCLGIGSTYYKRLHDSGLVNFVIFNKNKATNPAKYVTIPGAKSGNATVPKLYVYRTPVIYMKDANGNYDKPRIGNKKLKLKPRDDAIGVKVIRVRDIANGTYAMPFLHVYFAREYYKNYCQTEDLPTNLVAQLDVVYDLSRIRNHRIMEQVNKLIAGKVRTIVDKDSKIIEDLGPAKPFAFDFEAEANKLNREEVTSRAAQLSVNVDSYLNTANDKVDVDGCTNSWNFTIYPHEYMVNGTVDETKLNTLKDGRNSASDTVPIITDLNGDDWFVLIIRGNAPGKGNYAWPGGFVDGKETFAEAAKREFDEEVGGSSELGTGASDVNVETAITDLGTTIQLDWDPRIKVFNGMTVGASVFHNYFFPKNANGGNNKSMRKYKCKAPTQ